MENGNHGTKKPHIMQLYALGYEGVITGEGYYSTLADMVNEARREADEKRRKREKRK